MSSSFLVVFIPLTQRDVRLMFMVLFMVYGSLTLFKDLIILTSFIVLIYSVVLSSHLSLSTCRPECLSCRPPPQTPTLALVPSPPTQPDDPSLRLESASLADSAVSAGGHGVKKSQEVPSCEEEDEEEGHLVYHVGLVLKGRCIHAFICL